MEDIIDLTLRSENEFVDSSLEKELLNERNRLLSISPIDKKEDYENYHSTLTNIFQPNNHVNTIAVVGSYGSGKSTLIKNFGERSKKKFLYVSALPYIQKNKKQQSEDKEGVQDSKFDEISIEKRVIEQIYNQSISLSSLRLKYWIYYVSSFLLAVLLFVFFFLRDIPSLINVWMWLKNKFLFGIESEIVVVIPVVLWLIYSLYLFKENGGIISFIDKIKISSIEMQLNKDSFDLNKATTQLIRTLRKTNYDAIIVEDLDRFSDKKIIFQLREFANLYNRSTKNRKKFVFLLDYITIDDQEVNAKFFDYSLNIIPFLSQSYSFGYVKRIQQVCSKLGNKSLANVSDDLIKLLTRFIHDSRQMRIILNDYFFQSESYYSSLSPKEEVDRMEFENLLLSISVYRHLYTKDYNNFLKGKGVVYGLLINPETSQLKNLNKEIDVFKKRKQQIESDFAYTVNELKILYVFKEHDPNYFETGKRNGYSYRISDSDLNFIEDNEGYQNRLASAIENRDKLLSDINDKITKLEQKIAYYFPKGDETLAISLDGKKPQETEMLRELIFSGFLNSKMSLYISYGTDGLTIEELKLIEKVNDKDQTILPNIKVALENVSKVIGQLSDSIIEQSKFFNYDVFNYLRIHQRQEQKYLIMLKNIENRVLESFNSAQEFCDIYNGMVRHNNSLEQILDVDATSFSGEFIDSFFEQISEEITLQSQINILFKLVLQKHWNESKNLSGILKFLNGPFNLYEFYSTIKQEDFNIVFPRIIELFKSPSVKLNLKNMYFSDIDSIHEVIKAEYQEMIYQKVNRGEFVVNQEIITFIFYGNYNILNKSDEQIKIIIEYLVSNPEKLLESLILNIDNEDELFLMTNEAIEQLGIIEKLLSQDDEDITDNIIGGIVNYSKHSDKELDEYKVKYKGKYEYEWFDDLSKISNNYSIKQIIINEVFVINKINNQFLIKKFNSEQYTHEIFRYALKHPHAFDLEYSELDNFYLNLFNMFDNLHKDPSDYLNALPKTVLEHLFHAFDMNTLHEQIREALLLKNLVEINNDSLDFICIASLEVIDNYLDIIKQNLNFSRLEALIRNQNLTDEVILSILKDSKSFNREIYAIMEDARSFVPLSTNRRSITIQKKNKSANQIENYLNQLTLLKNNNFITFEDSSEKIKIQIKWSTKKLNKD